MTDRELMQMALEWIEAQREPRMIGAFKILKALRNRLAQPKWVGLTDEEVWECYSDRGSVFYRAVEAKLKEKNT